MIEISKLTYRPSDYCTSHIILTTISKIALEHMVGREELDGFHLDMTTIEGDLTQVVRWIRILILTVLAITLVPIAVGNFFAPYSKDVSQRVIDRLFIALNLENIALPEY